MPWIALQCVIVVFPDHTHLLFNSECSNGLYPAQQTNNLTINLVADELLPILVGVLFQLLKKLVYVLCDCILICRITTTITGRNVLPIITGEMLASSCFSRKVSVSLHQKGWQLTLIFNCSSCNRLI